MFKNLSISAKVTIISCTLCLVNIAWLIYQLFNLVVSVWNIGMTMIVVFILFGNIKNMTSEKVKSGEESPSPFGVTVSDNKRVPPKNEDFYVCNTSFPSKLTIKSIILKVVFLVIFIGLTCLFGVLGNSIKYDQVVTGTIISKTYEGGVNTEYDNDSGEVVTEDNRFEVLLVSYEVNGVIYRSGIAIQTYNTRSGSFMKVCAMNDGEFVCSYGKIVAYKIMFYTCIFLAVLTILGIVFKLPNADLVMLIFMFVGVGLICILNGYNWEGWLLFDINLFCGNFVSLGIICYIQILAHRIIFMIRKRRNPNFTMT